VYPFRMMHRSPLSSRRLLAALLVPAAFGVSASSAQAGVVVNNTLEGGTNGTTLSVANSGGTSGSAFNGVTIGTGATFAFDNARAAHGAMAAKVSTGSTAALADAQWSGALGNQTEIWGRIYVYLTGLPAATINVVTIKNGSQVEGGVNITSTGKVAIFDGASGTATGTVTVGTNQWVRIAFHLMANASNGAVDAKLFNTMDATTSSDAASIASAATGQKFTSYELGLTTATANVSAFWVDDLQINNTGWPGPSGGTLTATTSATPSVSATLNGTDQTPSFTLPITLSDLTGTGNGWNLAITSTQYDSGNPKHYKLPTSASQVTAVSFTCTIQTCAGPTNAITYPISVPAASTAPAAVKFFNAAIATGMGSFTATPTITVTIPANAFAASYTSTLTITINSGP
jgi:hypothetical protein